MGCFLTVLPIALGDARAAHLNFADMPVVADDLGFRINDSDLVTDADSSAADQFTGMFRSSRFGAGNAQFQLLFIKGFNCWDGSFCSACSQ